MNFVVDSLATERALWSLSAVENHARECLSMGVDGGLSSRSFLAWRERRLIRIQSGRPIQNGRVESFNGRLRDECLNANWCPIMSEAKRKLEAWRADFAHDAHAMWLQWRQMNRVWLL